MHEHEVVAAIVAGDPSGITEALDTYAESLFARCQALLPEAEAAEVVTDTFIIAREKLAGLRDPARLGAWLEAVARNECYRRLTARGEAPAEAAPEAVSAALPVWGEPSPQTPAAEGLTGRILKVCTDETATGRADRTTVAHLAGQFGHDGFPKPVSVPRQLRPGQGRPGRRRQLSRPLIATGAIVVAVALVAAISVIIGSRGSHPGQAAAAAAATSQLADDAADSTGPSVDPGPSASASTQATRPPARKSSSQHKQSSPTPSASTAQATQTQSTPAQPPSAPPTTPPPATTAAPTKPAAGVLRVSPGSLTITTVNNKPNQSTVTITAVGGPVYGISVSVPQPAGHLLVSPVPGSLGSGKQTQLLITAWGKHSFTATIILSPGDVVISIMVIAAS